MYSMYHYVYKMYVCTVTLRRLLLTVGLQQ